VGLGPAGCGQVFSWVLVNRPFLLAFVGVVPFVTGLVTIAEDHRVRLATRLVNVSDEPVEIGMEASADG
jgi:uncharacterized OB-fold protein